MPPHKRLLNEAFGEVIREWRIKKGLTQEQLSFKAKLHRTYISDLERGRKSPTLDVIDSLASALGTESHALLEAASRYRVRSGTRTKKRFRASS
jgi:transcriptional regulator with XRE-family HTH domain